MTENMFVIAVQNKYRFPSSKNMLTVEDLFDLNKFELNEIFKKLRALVKSDEDSLLKEESDEDIVLTTKIEIVKYIVELKKKEEEEVKEALRKQKILRAISKKEEEKFDSMSIEDLKKLL